MSKIFLRNRSIGILLVHLTGACVITTFSAASSEARVADGSLEAGMLLAPDTGVFCRIPSGNMLSVPEGDIRPPAVSKPIQVACSVNATKNVIAILSDVERVCASVAKEYRIDCLGDGLVFIGRNMPRGDYKAAGSALKNAGSRLKTIAKINRDTGKSDLGLNSSATRWAGSKKFTPVQASRASGN